MQTQNSFSLRSRALQISRVSAKQDYSVGVMARQRRLLSSAASYRRSRCCLPWALQRFLKESFKRAPRATGVFIKMASRSCVSGCGRFLASSDGHDRCRVRLRGPLTPRAHRTVWDSRMSMQGPRTGQGPASHSVPQQMTGYRSLHRGDALGSGEDDSAALPPSGRVALPESDPELTAMLSRAVESIGLHYRPPPSPERSRLDDWFLGAQAERRQPPPVPFENQMPGPVLVRCPRSTLVLG